MAIKRAIKAGNKSIISFKKVIKVGAVAQLLDKNNLSTTTTINGITFTNNEDGTITVNGTATEAANLLVNNNEVPIIKNHIYCVLGSPFGGSPTTYATSTSWGSENGNGIIQKNTRDLTFGNYWIHIEPNYTANNLVFIPQVFDLTEMFGAGHEPATVAEFKAKFPEAYYPYQRAVLTAYNKVVRPCVRKGEVMQLVDPTTITPNATIANMPLTYNGEGTFYLSGTASAAGGGRAGWGIFIGMIKGHKYLTESFYDKMLLLFTDKTNMGNYQAVDKATPIFEFFKESGQYIMGWNVNSGETYDVTITPQLFDLTAMYGAGNEPKTLADFRKDFPESYYPYSPIQTKNLFDIRRYTGLINSHLNNLSANYFVKNLTQNSLTVKLGGYEDLACLKEPIILPAGTYTFSCDCDYDAINNGNMVRLGIYKKNEAGNRLVEFKTTAWKFLHRLVLTFTLEEETAVYLELQGNGIPANYTNLNNVFFNIQLEKGSVATDYVPHNYI